MKDPGASRETAEVYLPQNLRLTYEDYCRMPSGHRYELVEGDIRMTPSPSVFHQKVSGRLEKALRDWVESRNLGEVYDSPIDVVLSEHNVVQPDILYISSQRLGIIKEAYIRAIPDLVIEILSPSTAEWDRGTKRRLYVRYGVSELWLVDPESHSIEVAAYRGSEMIDSHVFQCGSTLNSTILPGLTMDVDSLFRP